MHATVRTYAGDSALADTLAGHEAEIRELIGGIDGFQARALRMLASGKVRDAFDLEKEPDRVRARYGHGRVKHGNHPGPVLLQARRLIEAGVSVVTACVYGAGPWDTHRRNFITLGELLPPLDQAVSALIVDLEARGLLQDVAVLMGGEFGRTPRIGDSTPDGRGHWPQVMSALIAGGGLKMGQAIGASNARAELPRDRRCTPSQVLSTIYHAIGIDPAQTFPNQSGRPMYVLEDRQPLTELL